MQSPGVPQTRPEVTTTISLLGMTLRGILRLDESPHVVPVFLFYFKYLFSKEVGPELAPAMLVAVPTH